MSDETASGIDASDHDSRARPTASCPTGEAQTDMVYRNIEAAMRRLAVMPGQRVMVFVSPGFIVTLETREQGDLIDRANRSNIVINTDRRSRVVHSRRYGRHQPAIIRFPAKCRHASPVPSLGAKRRRLDPRRTGRRHRRNFFPQSQRPRRGDVCARLGLLMSPMFSGFLRRI